MMRCELPDDLIDVTARWTINGVTPTPAAPSRCIELDSFKIGAGDGHSGFVETVACADGVGQLPRVPASMTRVSAFAYKLESAGQGTFSVVGSAEVERSGANDVTLAIQLP